MPQSQLQLTSQPKTELDALYSMHENASVASERAMEATQQELEVKSVELQGLINTVIQGAAADIQITHKKDAELARAEQRTLKTAREAGRDISDPNSLQSVMLEQFTSAARRLGELDAKMKENASANLLTDPIGWIKHRATYSENAKSYNRAVRSSNRAEKTLDTIATITTRAHQNNLALQQTMNADVAGANLQKILLEANTIIGVLREEHASSSTEAYKAIAQHQQQQLDNYEQLWAQVADEEKRKITQHQFASFLKEEEREGKAATMEALIFETGANIAGYKIDSSIGAEAVATTLKTSTEKTKELYARMMSLGVEAVGSGGKVISWGATGSEILENFAAFDGMAKTAKGKPFEPAVINLLTQRSKAARMVQEGAGAPEMVTQKLDSLLANQYKESVQDADSGILSKLPPLQKIATAVNVTETQLYEKFLKPKLDIDPNLQLSGRQLLEQVAALDFTVEEKASGIVEIVKTGIRLNNAHYVGKSGMPKQEGYIITLNDDDWIPGNSVVVDMSNYTAVLDFFVQKAILEFPPWFHGVTP